MAGKINFYTLYGRGTWYKINSKGEFFVNGKASKTWKIYGVAQRWNGRPIPWKSIKIKLDKGQSVKGYLYDIDHGTTRFWGGSWGGKLPVVELSRGYF